MTHMGGELYIHTSHKALVLDIDKVSFFLGLKIISPYNHTKTSFNL